jgi:general secretion pathway protein G
MSDSIHCSRLSLEHSRVAFDYYRVSFDCSRLSSRPNRAFTLTEVMIALAIVAILTGAMIYNYQGIVDKSKPNRVRLDLDTLTNAIDRYTRDTGRPFQKVRDLRVLEGKYIDRVPDDPWGRPYKVDGTFVYSQGPTVTDHNGKLFRDDDIQEQFTRRAFISNPSFENAGKDLAASGWRTNLPGDSGGGFSGMGDQNIIQVDVDADAAGQPNSIVIRP